MVRRFLLSFILGAIIFVINPVILPFSGMYLAQAASIPSKPKLYRLLSQSLLSFNQAIKSKSFEVFHFSQLSQRTQKELPPKKWESAFKSFIQQKIDISGVKNEIPIFEKVPTIRKGHLYLEGYYLIQPQNVKFRADYIYENNHWKLTSLGVNTKELKTTVSGLKKIPDDKTLKRMATETLLAFNSAVQAQDFSTFYKEYLSGPLKRMYSPAKFHKAFKIFITRKVNYKGLENLSPTFIKSPAIVDDAYLLLKGQYNTSPRKLDFTLSYLYEEGEWKIADFNISFK